MNIQKDIRYGINVWINKETDILRKKECMCFNCKRLNKCDIAKRLYAICVDNDLALMITRCKDFISITQ